MKIWLRRGLIGFGAVLALLVVAAVVIPLIVNIDQYRPQIEEVANQHINGKLKIGKLGLSLWGRIEIDIRDVQLVDAQSKDVLSFKQAYALIPFWTFLRGAPRLTFRLDKPDVTILKDKRGMLNVASLAKPVAPAPGGAAPTEPAPSDSAAAGKPAADLPGMALIAAASIDIELINAALRYLDEASDFSQRVQDLNVRIRDLSLTKSMRLEIWADIATKVGSQLSVTGPFRIDGRIKPQFAGLDFQQADIDMRIKFDDLVVAVPGVFQKSKGIPANIKTSLRIAKDRLVAESLLLTFHNAQLQASAAITDLQPPSADVAAKPRLDFKLASTSIDLGPWNALIEPLKGFDVAGAMTLAAEAKGPLSKIDYQANLDIKDFSANIPGLQAKPTLQVNVAVVTDELKQAKVLVEAPENHVLLNVNVKNFAKPNVLLTLDSNGINLDKLLPPPAEPEKVAASPASPGASSSGAPGSIGSTQAAAEPPLDVDAMLEPVRSSDFLKGLITKVVVRIKNFKGMKLDVQNIKVDFKLQNLVAAIENLQLDIFKGQVKTKMSLDIKPAQPKYDLNLDIAALDLQAAVVSQLQSLKNTVLGKLSVKAAGKGESLNSDKLVKNLQIAGDFKIADATFATIDVAKMVVEGLNGSLGQVKQKVPGMGDKEVKNPGNRGMKYKVIASDFKMSNGIVSAPNFVAESEPKLGIDLKGNTEIGLLDDTLKAEWFVVDTYDITGARSIGISSNGIQVDHLLAKGNEPVSFPVVVGCKLSAPCYKYDAIAAHLGAIALANITAKVRGRADALIKEQQEKLRAQAAKAAELAKKKEDEARAALKAKEDEARAAVKAKEEQAKKEAEEKAKKQVGDKAKEKLKGLKW